MIKDTSKVKSCTAKENKHQNFPNPALITSPRTSIRAMNEKAYTFFIHNQKRNCIQETSSKYNGEEMVITFPQPS